MHTISSVAPAALHRLLGEYTTLFAKTNDEYLQERLNDVRDVIIRLSGHLSDVLKPDQANFDGPLIVIADELLPSQVVALGDIEVRGIVTQKGSQTSHAAIVARSRGKSRSISLTEEVAQELNGFPMAGRVAAGALMEAIEQHERLDVSQIWPQKGTYVLEVDGDSMIDAQIAPGDYVVVKKKNTASRGDIVVARTSDGDATLKYWFPEKNRIRLQPANKRLKPIFTKDAKVIGVVIGVIRDLK